MGSVVQDEKDKPGAERFPDYDILAVRNKQPGFKYRWIKNTDRGIARQQSRGWSIIDGGPEKSVLTPWDGMKKKGTDVDGTITYGDLILAKMPEDVYEERLAKPNREQIAAQISAARTGFLSQVGNLGIDGGEDLANRMTMKQYEEMAQRNKEKK